MIIGTETIQQVTEHYIVQNEENEGRGEENAELLINYDNIDIAEKQNILEKIVKIMRKKTSQTTKIYKNDRARLKADIKLADEVFDISYYPIVRNKRNKKQEERSTILQKKNRVKYKCTSEMLI